MFVLATKELKSILTAFICTWGLQLLFGMSVRNPLTLVFFAVFYYIGKRTGAFRPDRLSLAALAMAAALSACLTYLLGKRAVAGFDSSMFKLLGNLIIFVGLFVAVLEVLLCFINLNKADGKNTESEKYIKIKALDMSDGVVFVASTVICFLCWLPYFLYEYPGIMTADSIVQYEQIIGINPLSNHHPVIHTIAIGFFYNIGLKLTGDVNRAIGFYTVAQMVFLSVCCGRVTVQVKRVLKNNPAFLFATVFFALVPFNAVFAVTIWKDVPFAGIMMLMGCRLCEMLGKKRVAGTDYIILTILSVLMSLFRSNGWYAFLLCAPFLIWAFGKDTVKILLSVAGAIIVTVIVKGPVMNAAGIIQPDFTESLSLPVQQVARVLVDDKEVAENDMELIKSAIDTTYIHELYAADFADNIKELVRAGHPEIIENNKGTYLGLWMRLGAKYPLEYLKAWFDLEGGYVYPDISYEVGNIDGIMGNDYGLVSTPRIGGVAVVKGKEILIKLGSFVPLYGMLWCAGAYTWIAVAAMVLIICKDRKWLPFAILQAALICTLLIAAPVVDFRYEYGITMLMPLTVSICVMIMMHDTQKNA
ncbi:DUF6020 family protein [Butyrivibrio sp. JL13D10]|uniref:DUF6020 family protein n=1 Tax=Butyrivibrio sp. JL13D10 TaxID=3236815 RepID=UPI0038B52773